MSGRDPLNAEQREHLRLELEAMRAEYGDGVYVGIVTDDDPLLWARDEEDESWQGYEKATDDQIADLQEAIDLGDELDGLRTRPTEQP
ncbi:MAG TPA: hypothetical protein VD838_00590 [Anaeromyxobacteraceae bacterium]|nr:hypothetical protein [Anaeromyxobacteraceae bacterium]